MSTLQSGQLILTMSSVMNCTGYSTAGLTLSTLKVFFEENRSDLCGGYFGYVSVDEAVQRTLLEAEILESRLFALAEGGRSDPHNTLQQLFEPLNNHEWRLTEHQRSKAKIRPIRGIRWLRLYAIRIEPGLFVVSGGTIKLTGRMEERPHTSLELKKLDKVKAYLQQEGLYAGDDFQFQTR